jgi:SAM-dependent methyltransferase
VIGAAAPRSRPFAARSTLVRHMLTDATLRCPATGAPLRRAGDASFDAVVAQAVLEHVADPARAVAEMHRVLVAGGLVYAEIPFMQQVHEGAYDFRRYTHVGLRRLFRDFDEVAAGPVCGPAMALGGRSATSR